MPFLPVASPQTVMISTAQASSFGELLSSSSSVLVVVVVVIFF